MEEETPKEKQERWLPKYLEDKFEILLRTLFFWETDEKRIGICIRFLHHSLIYIVFLWFILIHTIMPSYILFLFFYCFVGIVWIQHWICWGCLFNKVERRLIGDTKSFVDPILETFHIPITSESTDGVVILGSTAVMFMLTFELLARTITSIQRWFS
jgi:hypothetical protein